jgi:hypothetical protein
VKNFGMSLHSKEHKFPVFFNITHKAVVWTSEVGATVAPFNIRR